MTNKDSGGQDIEFKAHKPKTSDAVAKAVALGIMAEVATSGLTDKDQVKVNAAKIASGDVLQIESTNEQAPGTVTLNYGHKRVKVMPIAHVAGRIPVVKDSNSVSGVTGATVRSPKK